MNKELTSGGPVVDESYKQIDPVSGQQKAYVVLSAEERAKGFVRPVRQNYRHVGIKPKNLMRDLTVEELERYAPYDYAKFETYPESEFPVTGKFWTQKELDARGCGVVTTMGLALAETYSRDPSFYGATFCAGCKVHLPVNQFIWDGTDEVVGS